MCIYLHVCIVGHIIVTCVASCGIRSRAKHLTRKKHAGSCAKRRMFVYTPPHGAYMLSAKGHIPLLWSLPPRICVQDLVCRNNAMIHHCAEMLQWYIIVQKCCNDTSFFCVQKWNEKVCRNDAMIHHFFVSDLMHTIYFSIISDICVHTTCARIYGYITVCVYISIPTCITGCLRRDASTSAIQRIDRYDMTFWGCRGGPECTDCVCTYAHTRTHIRLYTDTYMCWGGLEYHSHAWKYAHICTRTHTHTHTLCIVILVEENLHDMSHLMVSITHIQPGAQTRRTENHVTHTADESWSTHECTTCVTALSLRHHTRERLRSGAHGRGGL